LNLHKKHIAFTQRHLDSHNGGEERSLYSIIKHLSKENKFTISLFYKKLGDYNQTLPKSISQFNILEEELLITNFLAFFWSILKTIWAIKKHKIDHIHVNHYKDVTWVACLKKITGIELTLHLRLNAPEYLSRQYAWGLNQVDKFVANSEFVKKDWVKTIDENKITVIYNGIEIINEEIESINEPVDLLFIGRLVYEKGLHLAIEALSELPTSRTLTVIGDFRHSSERGENEYELEIYNLITKLKLENRIIFKGHQKYPISFIKNATAVLVPSYHDSFGRTYMESWSLGVPAIASNCGGLIELCELKPELKNYVFKEGDFSDLANVIHLIPQKNGKITLFSMKELIEKLSEFLD